MKLSLSVDIERLIAERVASGRYRTAEDVVAAAVSVLEQQERWGEFRPGEMDGLLEEGERDTEAGRVVEGEAVFAELRRMSEEKRGGTA
jgi:antitoxin ParD1/3/4